MIAGEGTELIHRTARDIYEFVLDPERYKKADLKIGTVYSLTWRGDRGGIHGPLPWTAHHRFGN
jgi:hypothetical protein